MKYYDNTERVAKMLLSDGTVLDADAYSAGSRGFVEAVWLAPAAKFELEVVNSLLRDGIIVAAEKPRKKKKT